MNRLFLQVSIFLLGFLSLYAQAFKTERINVEQVHYWNHTKTFPEQYLGLLNKGEHYTPAITNADNNTNIDVTLIKKIANWHQQHSNGLKITFDQQELTFGALNAVSFSMLVDKEASNIPNNTLLQKYQKYIKSGLIDEVWFDELLPENGVVNIALFGEHHENQNIATVMGNYQLYISESMFSEVNELSIPIEFFDFYQQKDWNETVISFNEIKNIKVLGILITAETKNQKTLRSYLQDSYPNDIKESYIELDLKLKNMAITHSFKN